MAWIKDIQIKFDHGNVWAWVTQKWFVTHLQEKQSINISRSKYLYSVRYNMGVIVKLDKLTVWGDYYESCFVSKDGIKWTFLVFWCLFSFLLENMNSTWNCLPEQQQTYAKLDHNTAHHLYKCFITTECDERMSFTQEWLAVQ